MSAQAQGRSDSVSAGIAWMVVTTLCFACVTGIVRYVGTAVSAPEAAFIRYAFGVVFFLPLAPRLIRNPPTLGIMKLHTARGLFHGCAVILWFWLLL